jgi:hypothetical protein
MNANYPEQQPTDFPQGLPIYDRNGEKLGVVSADGVQENYLIMTEGRLFHHDVSVPISAIERSDSQAVYLNRTQQEIHDLTLGGWSSLGDVDLDTGVPASTIKETPTEAFQDGEDVVNADC